jgi:multiple sugar transport system permease protein
MPAVEVRRRDAQLRRPRRLGDTLSAFVDRRLAVLFPLPAVAFVLLLMVFPIAYNFRLSLTEWSMAALRREVGLANYLHYLGQDPRFWPAAWRTFYFTIVAVAVETTLGTAIALLLNRNFRGRDVVRTLLLLPVVATPVAVGLVWLLLFEPTVGLLNYLLGGLHIPPQRWLASPAQVIPSLVLVDVWQWTPMIALLVLAGLAVAPVDPVEAAVVDGATPAQVLVYVTLPFLRPTIVAAVMLRSIDALKTFDIIYTMTQGGPGFASETLNLYAFTTAFQYFRMGSAAALLVLFFVIVLGVAAGLARARRAEWAA